MTPPPATVACPDCKGKGSLSHFPIIYCPTCKGTGQVAAPDGWIPWSGGECPVETQSECQIKLRDGTTMNGIARFFGWEKNPFGYCDRDIVAYRLAPQSQKGEPALMPAFRKFCEANAETTPSPPAAPSVTRYPSVDALVDDGESWEVKAGYYKLKCERLERQTQRDADRIAELELQQLRDTECIERITKHGLELEIKLRAAEAALRQADKIIDMVRRAPLLPSDLAPLEAALTSLNESK